MNTTDSPFKKYKSKYYAEHREEILQRRRLKRQQKQQKQQKQETQNEHIPSEEEVIPKQPEKKRDVPNLYYRFVMFHRYTNTPFYGFLMRI
jgi:hypothetical protein